MTADAEETAIRFDIPAQDLGEALNEFALQSGQEILYVGRDVEGRSAPGIEGSYEPTEALNLLLADTSLGYKVSELDTILVGSTSVAGGDSESKNSRSQPTLMAQSQTTPTRSSANRRSATGDVERDTDVERLEEIVVTGSRIRGAESASPIVTIDRVEIDRAGFATVEEVIENLPQNFGAGATSDATNDTNLLQALGGNVRDIGGGTSVNLRGLGASSTLVLVNGRRLSPGGNEARFTNIASIPLTAVERVEVMTDGASAIYGSDAIGGVINFIMRTDYDGAETRLRHGTDARGGTSDILLGQAVGKSWSTGNVVFSYEYFDSDPLAAADRDFTASNDLSPFGGTDNRVIGGNPANLVAGGQTFAIPAGQDGTSLTAADFDAARSPNLFNANEFTDQIGSVERHSASLFLTQNFGSVNIFGQARFSTEDNSRRAPVPLLDLIDIPVTQTSPFFVDPTGTGLSEVTVENYSILDDFGPRVSSGEIDTLGATAGVRFDLGNDWSLELVGNWSKEEAAGFTTNEIDIDALLAAANDPNPDMAFNPFGDGSNTNPALLASLVIPSERFNGLSENELWSISLNANGTLFDGPGGAVKLATGIDYRDESLLWVSGSRQVLTDEGRGILAAYGELFFPIVGESNARAGLRRFEISLAARFEDYSDFGSATNPKLGLLWSPSNSMTFRGTFGTSYRAPSLRDLNTTPGPGNSNQYFSDFFVNVLPLAPFPFILLSGANEDLQPEEAVTWTAGFQWRPERVSGLSIDVTYFNIDFDDRISNPIRNVFAAITDPALASLINTNPTIEEITAIVNDPRYEPDILGGPHPAADLISGALPVDAIVFNRRVNSAQLIVTGAQLQLAYDVDTRIGVIGINLNADYLFDFERRIVEADPLVEEVDTMGRPVDFRARGGANLSRGSWTVSGFVNYTDGYTDVFHDPVRSVDSWTTVDATIAYRTGGGAGFLSDTRLAITTQNLLNEDPPFVDTLGGIGYDATVANPLGRFFALQITKDW